MSYALLLSELLIDPGQRVAAVQGPVMGIAAGASFIPCHNNNRFYSILAAFLGFFDFIYAMPNVWLSVPFTFLG